MTDREMLDAIVSAVAEHLGEVEDAALREAFTAACNHLAAPSDDDSVGFSTGAMSGEEIELKLSVHGHRGSAFLSPQMWAAVAAVAGWSAPAATEHPAVKRWREVNVVNQMRLAAHIREGLDTSEFAPENQAAADLLEALAEREP